MQMLCAELLALIFVSVLIVVLNLCCRRCMCFVKFSPPSASLTREFHIYHCEWLVICLRWHSSIFIILFRLTDAVVNLRMNFH